MEEYKMEIERMQEEERLKEIERLRAWNERMEAERIVNQAEADAIALILAEQKTQPTLEQQVAELQNQLDELKYKL